MGKYEILCRLSTGGMSEIFLAYQRGLAGFQKLVVLKSILPDIRGEEEFVRMFLDEAKITAAFNHPNIAHVFDLGIDEGVLFLAMEFVPGCTLVEVARACRQAAEPIPIGFTLAAVRDSALALHYAHNFTDPLGRKQVVIHRDVAEKNIMVTYEGVTKLLDFGIAKSLNRTQRTSVGMVKGTSGYMSPEQILGETLDARSDVFSAGVVLHECLTGVRLFHGKNPEDGMLAALKEDVAPPSKQNRAVPRELDAVVLKALARDRKDRYPSALEFARAIERAGGDLIWHPEQSGELVQRLFAERRAQTRQLLAQAQSSAAGEVTGELALRGLIGGQEGSGGEITANLGPVPAPEIRNLVEAETQTQPPRPPARTASSANVSPAVVPLPARRRPTREEEKVITDAPTPAVARTVTDSSRRKSKPETPVPEVELDETPRPGPPVDEFDQPYEVPDQKTIPAKSLAQLLDQSLPNEPRTVPSGDLKVPAIYPGPEDDEDTQSPRRGRAGAIIIGVAIALVLFGVVVLVLHLRSRVPVIGEASEGEAKPEVQVPPKTEAAATTEGQARDKGRSAQEGEGKGEEKARAEAEEARKKEQQRQAEEAKRREEKARAEAEEAKKKEQQRQAEEARRRETTRRGTKRGGTRVAAVTKTPETEVPAPEAPAASGAMGKLTVVADQQVKLYLRSQLLGDNAAFFLLPVPAGTHVLRVVGQDGKARSLTVVIKENQTTSVKNVKVEDLPAQ